MLDEMFREDGGATFVGERKAAAQVPNHLDFRSACLVHIDPILFGTIATAKVYEKIFSRKLGEKVFSALVRAPIMIGRRNPVGAFASEDPHHRALQPFKSCVAVVH